MKIRASLLVTVLLVGLMPVLTAEPASATTITARSMLFKLAAMATQRRCVRPRIDSGPSESRLTLARVWRRS